MWTYWISLHPSKTRVPKLCSIFSYWKKETRPRPLPRAHIRGPLPRVQPDGSSLDGPSLDDVVWKEEENEEIEKNSERKNLIGKKRSDRKKTEERGERGWKLVGKFNREREEERKTKRKKYKRKPEHARVRKGWMEPKRRGGHFEHRSTKQNQSNNWIKLNSIFPSERRRPALF